MTLHHVSPDRLADDLRFGSHVPEWAVPGEPNVVVVEGDGGEITIPPGLCAVVVSLDPQTLTPPEWCDVVCTATDLDQLAGTVHRNPIAATALAQLLRNSATRSMAEGLLLESAVYSALQAGPEFARWRATTPRRVRVESGQATVIVERDGNVLRLGLNRPHVHNALSARMRDELLEALEIARLDTSVEVELFGIGPSYSAGGDLDEFGSFDDPASAHLVRGSTSIGAVIAALGPRATVHLHGASAGSGIEISAFAHHVTGSAELAIWLPEVSLGLVPGAGGTWSIPRRIGRHRTAWLALTGRRIGLAEALEWGLVGESA